MEPTCSPGSPPWSRPPKSGVPHSVYPLFLKLTFRLNSTHWVAMSVSPLTCCDAQTSFALPNHSSVHLGLDFPAKRSWYKVPKEGSSSRGLLQEAFVRNEKSERVKGEMSTGGRVYS